MNPIISSSTSASMPARILVVDDEPDIAQVLHDYLTYHTPHQVTMVYNAQTAITALANALDTPQGAFDLVLLDMRMPTGNEGREVLDWIRTHPDLQYTRVIILTATNSHQERIEALSAGADDYITKPYQHQELLARVKTILRSHTLEKQLHYQSQQLALLNQVSTAITSLRNTSEIFSGAVEGTRRILGVDVAAIFIGQAQSGWLECRQLSASQQPIPVYSPIPIGKGIIGQLFAKQHPVCLHHPQNDSRFDPHFDAPSHYPVQNLLAAPLYVRNRPVGVLVALNKHNGRFSQTDKDLFLALSASVGHAIENAWLFQSVRQQHEALRKSRDRLQAVIDGIIHPIYTVNTGWQITAVNKNKLNELQVQPDALLGKICYQTFFQRKAPCERCAVPKVLQYKQAFRWSVRWLNEDHLPREWDVNAYPIPGQNSDAEQTVVVWQEITEERRLEYSLLQAGKLAAIGQLAAGVAHEMNNPLSVISASAHMLQMQIPPDDDRGELADMIAQASERATKVVRGLLDFARQEEYEFEETDLHESLHQALHLVSYQLQKAHVQVIENLAPDLPKIYASGEHLKTVWLNLMINARDALEWRTEGRQLELVTRLAATENHVQVLIRDNGKGMSLAEQEHILEPFYTTKDPGQGTGLGLATCHRIIEQHAGEIEVISSPGEGTIFVVRLPVNSEG